MIQFESNRDFYTKFLAASLATCPMVAAWAVSVLVCARFLWALGLNTNHLLSSLKTWMPAKCKLERKEKERKNWIGVDDSTEKYNSNIAWSIPKFQEKINLIVQNESANAKWNGQNGWNRLFFSFFILQQFDVCV